MFKCKKCGNGVNYKVFVPFLTPNRDRVSIPKWTFHIKSICFNCHTFNGFLKQEEDLMAELRDCVMMKMDLGKREYPVKEENIIEDFKF